jgi:hypothetical protein
MSSITITILYADVTTLHSSDYNTTPYTTNQQRFWTLVLCKLDMEVPDSAETEPQIATSHIEESSGKYRTSTTIYFDRQGDVRLEVDGTILVVSSKTMSLISDPWNAMLGPTSSFSEALSKHSKPILLPEDDIEALTIILHIAHLQFDKVPLQLEFDQLLSIAVLTDKYQATQIVRPWLSNWVNGLKHLVDEDGYEEWLWIAWEFGISDSFEHIANRLVLESRTNSDKQCLTSSGRVLTKNMPPDIIGKTISYK